MSQLRTVLTAGAVVGLGVGLWAAQADGPAEGAKARRNVAIFVHDGVEVLDFAGPGEVFAAAGGGRAFRVYTVAATKDPVTSQGFLKVTPEFAFTDAPKPDVVVLPGGATGRALQDPRVVEWAKRASADSEVTLSVCTGAFILARAGLLDGLEATTHWGSIERLKTAAPKTKVYADRRVVDNGKIVTAAGVSAGIDASLHVVGRLLGEKAAKDTARYMEYTWEPTAAKVAADPKAELMDADRAFAKATAEKGLDGWMSFMADDAVRILPLGGKVHVGTAEVRKLDAEMFADPKRRLLWEPTDGGAFADGKHGFTTGTSKMVARTDGGAEEVRWTGAYVTWWRKGGDGRWKVVLDTGAVDPPKK